MAEVTGSGPAEKQAVAYLPAHKLEAETNLSAMTVEFTFSVVAHSGVSSMDAADLLACGSVMLQLRRLADGVTPAQTYMASATAAWASR
jgi:hypothetical protein